MKDRTLLSIIFLSFFSLIPSIARGTQAPLPDQKSDAKEPVELGAAPAKDARPKLAVAFSSTHTRVSSDDTKVIEGAKLHETGATSAAKAPTKKRKKTIEELEDKSWCGRHPHIILGTLVTVLCAGLATGLGFGIKYILSLKVDNSNCLDDSTANLANECWKYQLTPPTGNVSATFCPSTTIATHRDVIASIKAKIGNETPFCASKQSCERSGNGIICTRFNSIEPRPAQTDKKAVLAGAKALLRARHALNTSQAQRQFNKTLPKRWQTK